MTFMQVLVVLIILSGLYYLRLQRRRRVPPLPPVQTAAGVAVEPLPNPYPPYHGTLRIHDPLQDNTAGYGWMDDSVQHTTATEGCHFCQEAYYWLDMASLTERLRAILTLLEACPVATNAKPSR